MPAVITNSKNLFKSSSFLFSKVKRFLRSYDFANIIDEGEFPTYTKEVLKILGLGVYRESQAIINIADYEGSLPEDFDSIYSSYRIHSTAGCDNVRQIPQSNFKFVTDVTKEYLLDTGNCMIDCCQGANQLVESINIKTYVEETGSTVLTRFDGISPLIISPNVHGKHNKDNPSPINEREIGIDYELNKVFTNFKEGMIYIKYYGFPIDDDGNIMIPDIEQVEKAIEWYIIYQILLSGWFNSTIPDISSKFQKAEQEYKLALGNAMYYLKLPSFITLVNQIRNQRSQNKLVFMSEQYSKTNFQRGR